MRHMKQKPIAVLFGGRSPEYEVSLASAAGVLEHMDRRRYLPVMVGITQQGAWYPLYRQHRANRRRRLAKRTGLHPGPPLPQPQGPKSSGISGGAVTPIPLDGVFPILHGKNRGKTAPFRACASLG